jgi:hypothetical protein
MYSCYVASISRFGLESLSRDDETVAEYLRSDSPHCLAIRAVIPERIADMVRREMMAGQKQLALATLDAAAVDLSRLVPGDKSSSEFVTSRLT